MVNLTATMLKSSKGRDLLVDSNNYSYRGSGSNAKKTVTFWRCCKDKCRARLSTKFDDINVILSTLNDHNHAVTNAEIEAKKVKAALKEASLSSQLPPRILLADAGALLSDEAKAALPKLPSMSRAINKWRARAHATPTLRKDLTKHQIQTNIKIEASMSLLEGNIDIDEDIKNVISFKTHEEDEAFSTHEIIVHGDLTSHSQNCTCDACKVKDIKIETSMSFSEDSIDIHNDIENVIPSDAYEEERSTFKGLTLNTVEATFVIDYHEAKALLVQMIVTPRDRRQSLPSSIPIKYDKLFMNATINLR